jgi:hypothetical protein
MRRFFDVGVERIGSGDAMREHVNPVDDPLCFFDYKENMFVFYKILIFVEYIGYIFIFFGVSFIHVFVLHFDLSFRKQTYDI